MHTLVRTTALNIITLFKTKEMHAVSYLSHLLAITNGHELNFKLHKERTLEFFEQIHERLLGNSFLWHCLIMYFSLQNVFMKKM